MKHALQKLRTVAIRAYAKIHLRSADKRPGKWEEGAYNLDGTRNWTLLTDNFLRDKLAEEVGELLDTILNGEPLDHVLNEAADVTNLAMFIADKKGCFRGSRLAPKVVCLCGSTKFKEQFLKVQFEETMKGNIVLTVGAFGHADKVIYRDSEKLFLDDLHKRKIDLADEIFVVNVGQYIGDSTKSEILYAQRTGKAVRWLEDPAEEFQPGT